MNKESIRPLHDKIFFTFVEDLSSTTFRPTSKFGIILTDDKSFSEGSKPQWGKVWKIGAEVSEAIKAGLYILIEPGKWTTRINVDNEPFWMTEESFVMATADDASATFKY
jgi:co-chaperonin GroES (HSP10)